MEYSTIFGIGMAFGLSLVLTYYTFRTLLSFLIWLSIFLSFVVWAGILDLWVLVFNFIGIIFVVYIKYRNRGNIS